MPTMPKSKKQETVAMPSNERAERIELQKAETISWIPIAEGLPAETQGSVLITARVGMLGDLYVMPAFYNGRSWYSTMGNKLPKIWEVLAWWPIPVAYGA